MRLHAFFIRIFSGKSIAKDHSYTTKEIKGDPYINKDKDGNPLPPWVNFPDISPFDYFYREAGQFWLCYVWNPFWETMSKEQQLIYLDMWKAPEVWRDWYSEEWQSFLHDDEFN